MADLQRPYDYLLKLRQHDAKHLRRGYTANEMSVEDVLKHAGEELIELAVISERVMWDETVNMRRGRELIGKEIGDILNCVLHVAVQHDISADFVIECMLLKLKERWSKPWE